MYFEDLSMRKSINCALVHQNGGFCPSGRTEAEICSLSFPFFVYKLAATLVNSVKIKCTFSIVFVLVLELRVNIAFVNEPEYCSWAFCPSCVFHGIQKG